MAVMKPVRPSLKERKRYAVIKIISENEISQDEIIKAINQSFLKYTGIIGYAKAGLLVLKNKMKKGYCIARVSHKHVDILKSAIMMIKEINGKKAGMNVIGISGVLKKASEKYMT